MSIKPSPPPHIILAWRQAAGQTQAEAAALVHVAEDTWYRWEAGTRPMPMGLFELYLLKSSKDGQKQAANALRFKKPEVL